MLLEAKIKNPIHIRLGNNSNVIMADENCKIDHPLTPGAMFGGEHYGFIIIIDNGGRQREIVYPTQCKVEAAGIENDQLKIFEEGKKNAWRFDKKGQLNYSALDDFTDEFRSKFDIIIENSDMFGGELKLLNPISIKIAKDPEKSLILKDEMIQQDYPLHPGALLGTVHYGFILIIDTDHGQKEITYPTQNKIEALGIEDNIFEDLKIFEKGKYHPWLFTFDGKLKKEASYNQNSRIDRNFVEEQYGLNESNSECFVLQKKK